MVEIKNNVKITVMKKLGIKELWGDDPPISVAGDFCSKFTVGDVYVTEGLTMPKDWPCSWAWDDIFKEVLHLALGGEFFPGPGNLIYTSCTNGLRPVFYKIKREE